MEELDAQLVIPGYPRRKAISEGLLYRVVAEQVPMRKVVSRCGPSMKAPVCYLFEEGTELVADGPPVDGWLPLHEVQLRGPLQWDGPQWVLLDGRDLGFGRLVSRVRAGGEAQAATPRQKVMMPAPRRWPRAGGA